jgi:hypothetical protein
MVASDSIAKLKRVLLTLRPLSNTGGDDEP